MMNPNILNKNPLMFFDRAVNAQRSQLLTVMADAVSECRTAADQAAELNETGQVGLLRLAEVWSTIRAKEGMGGAGSGRNRSEDSVRCGGTVLCLPVRLYVQRSGGNGHLCRAALHDVLPHAGRMV